MPGLALLSPINEAEELSPYQNSFRLGRYPGRRSPIAKSPFHYVRDTSAGSPASAEMTMDDLWIYDCYVSEDATSPGGYPRSPSTTSHSRSISLPSTTPSLSPVISVPVVKEPSPSIISAAPLPLHASRDTQLLHPVREDQPVDSPSELAYAILPVITTSVFSPGTPAEFPEYSPLEQEAMTIWEVIDELAAAADQFAGLETLLADACAADPPPEMDDDVAFWFIEGLNLLVGDYTEVARDLLVFNDFVEQLLLKEQMLAVPEVPRVKHASFSEQDMKEVLDSAARIPKGEVQEALAALEASVPQQAPGAKRKSRDRPPSLKLSTDDAVLIQALRPRSRFESVGAVGRFTDLESQSRSEMLKKHRAYAVYQEDTPTDDNWSTKSIVDYDAIEPMDEVEVPPESASFARPRPPSGQTVVPRPMSSPVASTGKSAARRPPSLNLADRNSERSSQHSASSSLSSLFSALPRSSNTSNSSPRSSPRLSTTFEGKTDKSRFPASSGNIKKMFSNLFKKREGTRNSMRPSKRTVGTGSVDATLSALSLSAMSSSSTLTPLALGGERDPFAASPPPPLRTPPAQQVHARSTSEASPLDAYSSMFNPLKAASKWPPQPLFGGVGEPTP
ncbi:hypothetical protein OH77DRAFT_802002 [Trametes cingulata]|nr:hypothetical protein OH77DRAFT_802002 [Trametes cingulata]